LPYSVSPPCLTLSRHDGRFELNKSHCGIKYKVVWPGRFWLNKSHCGIKYKVVFPRQFEPPLMAHSNWRGSVGEKIDTRSVSKKKRGRGELWGVKHKQENPHERTSVTSSSFARTVLARYEPKQTEAMSHHLLACHTVAKTQPTHQVAQTDMKHLQVLLISCFLCSTAPGRLSGVVEQAAAGLLPASSWQVCCCALSLAAAAPRQEFSGAELQQQALGREQPNRRPKPPWQAGLLGDCLLCVCGRALAKLPQSSLQDTAPTSRGLSSVVSGHVQRQRSSINMLEESFLPSGLQHRCRCGCRCRCRCRCRWCRCRCGCGCRCSCRCRCSW